MSPLGLLEVPVVQTTLTQWGIGRAPSASLFFLQLVILRQVLCGVIIENRIYVPCIRISLLYTV